MKRERKQDHKRTRYLVAVDPNCDKKLFGVGVIEVSCFHDRVLRGKRTSVRGLQRKRN